MSAHAANWVVDHATSQLGFRASMSGTGFEGRFERWTADIRFDPEKLKNSRIRVTIDMASARTGDADRDSSLPGRTWFEVKKYPEAVYFARSIRMVSPGLYVAQGWLTLRGVVRQLDLPFTLTINGGRAKAEGAVTIDRLAFGVGRGQWANNETISTAVTIRFALNAMRTP